MTRLPALDLRAVAGLLGALLGALGVALLAPAAVGLAYGHAPSAWAFGGTALGAMAAGGGAWRAFRPQRELRVREGILTVALAWLVLSLVGALPFLFAGVLDRFADAFFETMSGFTTTGATILSGADTPAIEDVPEAFLFWRSLTHWLGGMGIIVLTLAILPLLGVGGMQLFKAEVPGVQADKLTPRLAETAKRLWAIYVGLTAAQALLLLPAMSPFEAVNHAFATMATGGFSTENGSVADYGSAYVDWVITAFMLLAGINFALHYALLHGRLAAVLRSEELRAYLGAIVAATALVTLALWDPSAAGLPADVAAPGGATSAGGEALAPGEAGLVRYGAFADALRYGAFQVVAIVTTTGFGTADYEVWPALAVGVLFVLFFVGGMAGSTGGGVKVVRVVLLLKNTAREMRQLVHPQAVLPLRLDGRTVPETVMRAVLSFVALYVGLLFFGTLVLTFFGLDLLSAFSAAASCLGNVGPAFGSFGPSETYTHVSDAGKWVLALLMMAGRLELFTVLMVLTPAFWRK